MNHGLTPTQVQKLLVQFEDAERRANERYESWATSHEPGTVRLCSMAAARQEAATYRRVISAITELVES